MALASRDRKRLATNAARRRVEEALLREAVVRRRRELLLELLGFVVLDVVDRARASLLGLSEAEYLRDVYGLDATGYVKMKLEASDLGPVERRQVEEKLAGEYGFVPRGAPSPERRERPSEERSLQFIHEVGG